MSADASTGPAHPPLSELGGRRVTVMGLGLFGGGASVARFLARRGAQVTVTDLRGEVELEPALRELAGLPLRFVLGAHHDEDFAQAELVVANPAVAPRNRYLQLARSAGVPIASEIEFFLELCPARVVAVTGTQGKSSTCHTLHQLLCGAGFPAHLGGNIGRSLVEEADSLTERDVVVLELSSYQLEALPSSTSAGRKARVEAVAVTNVLADHLERHGTLEAYAAAKRRILELVDSSAGTAVLPAECPRLANWRPGSWQRLDLWSTRASPRGLSIRDGCFRLHDEPLGQVDQLRLPGEFQRENTLAALGLARVLGAPAQALAKSIPSLVGLPHRMQDLGLFRGHRVIDNGVSTTPDSTISAVRSMHPGFTLLLGGQPKQLPFEELAQALVGRARRVGVFGAAVESLPAVLRTAGVECFVARALDDSVQSAFELMQPGEELLFSPACASFDAFLNFRERALAFRRALPS
ncbi:MAG: UDP-N-acetylmuramoyl-L-alanine--D-glutamate ligase [Planctomycetes bacterium]|nr:UDP-N-acetylmuramoyl-L-alanine--D-glutamate ligase [Planctomycetota bacterium]